MNEKKNIDRLFQERFKDFEAIPNDKVWNKIHDALHEKKKKKVIPFWWKISGIAAGLILAFLIFDTFKNPLLSEPSVVVAPKESDKGKPKKLEAKPENETRVASENIDSLGKQQEINSNGNNLNSSITTEKKIALEKNRTSIDENDVQTNPNHNGQPKNVTTSKIRKNNLKISKNTAVAKNFNKKKHQEANENHHSLQEKVIFNSSFEKISNEKQLATKESNSNNNISVVSSENKVLNNNTIVKNIDSTALALVSETNPLEEILKKKNEKGEEVLATAKLNRWQVTTNVAPVYFNSVSNGSPIESQFAENSKSYDNNLSFGIGVQYALNKKLAVRTGLNKLTLGYGTNDVMFFGRLNAPGVNNLSADISTSKIEVISMTNWEGLKPFQDNIQNMEQGVLNQTMGYYEVPLELSYALINRKFGINIIGGLSTMFLSENSVSVKSTTTTMSLGKANNLNDVHFSSNIGLGLNYKFFKQFEANFEPTLKYQFNTFSRDAGSFKPYFIGLYTGVSYRF